MTHITGLRIMARVIIVLALLSFVVSVAGTIVAARYATLRTVAAITFDARQAGQLSPAQVQAMYDNPDAGWWALWTLALLPAPLALHLIPLTSALVLLAITHHLEQQIKQRAPKRQRTQSPAFPTQSAQRRERFVYDDNDYMP